MNVGSSPPSGGFSLSYSQSFPFFHPRFWPHVVQRVYWDGGGAPWRGQSGEGRLLKGNALLGRFHQWRYISWKIRQSSGWLFRGTPMTMETPFLTIYQAFTNHFQQPLLKGTISKNHGENPWGKWWFLTDSKPTNMGISWLVGGLEHFLCSHMLGIIIPID